MVRALEEGGREAAPGTEAEAGRRGRRRRPALPRLTGERRPVFLCGFSPFFSLFLLFPSSSFLSLCFFSSRGGSRDST